MADSAAAIAEDSCDNSVTEPLDKDDDCDATVQMHARKLFKIDTSKIESVPHCQRNAELQDLDLHVYNQDTFEQGPLLCNVMFFLHVFDGQQDYEKVVGDLLKF